MTQSGANLLDFMTDQFGRLHAKLDRMAEGLNALRSRAAAFEGDAAHMRVELAEVNARLERIDLRLDRLERPSASFPGS